MSQPGIDSFRLRRADDGQVVIEFGHRAAMPADGVPSDPALAFVGHLRIVMPEAAAWRLVDGLSLALGRPLAPAPERAIEPAPPLPLHPPMPPMPLGRARLPALDDGVDEGLRQRGTTPVQAPADPAGAHAAQLMAAVREMAPTHRSERSFRIAPGSLQANRFLLSIGAQHLPADAGERAWAIAHAMGLPASMRGWVDRAFRSARHLHFGFEGSAGRTMCKIYLERVVPAVEAAQARESGVPALQYEALKWDVETGDHVQSSYHWHAGLDVRAMQLRMADIWQGAPALLSETSHEILAQAASRRSADQLQYLEVREEGQPRRSFDLNVYDAGLQVRDLQAMLFSLRDHFGIRPGEFQALYDQIRSRPLGHVAGGIHRNGQPFFNVYFGNAPQR